MLTGIVIGTGWSGEGYATALRQAGVTVVVLCGRSLEPASAMGARLAIADVRTDWRAAAEDPRPDVLWWPRRPGRTASWSSTPPTRAQTYAR
jgi:predicted dehydrogenase